jgi:hypothetical protein
VGRLQPLPQLGDPRCGLRSTLARLPVERLEAAGLAVGFGGVTAVLWEFAEYFTFIRGGPEEKTAYTDTLGDIALGLTGATVAAVVSVTLLWRWQKEAR